MSQIIGKVGMTPRGMYDRTRAYERLDVVTYQGSSWVAIVDVPAQISPAMGSDYWQLQARMGETGPQGPVGPQGNSAFDGTGVELVNNLTQGGQTAALSAEQGKILKQELTELESETMGCNASVNTSLVTSQGFEQSISVFVSKGSYNITIETDATILGGYALIYAKKQDQTEEIISYFNESISMSMNATYDIVGFRILVVNGGVAANGDLSITFKQDGQLTKLLSLAERNGQYIQCPMGSWSDKVAISGKPYVDILNGEVAVIAVYDADNNNLGSFSHSQGPISIDSGAFISIYSAKETSARIYYSPSAIMNIKQVEDRLEKSNLLEIGSLLNLGGFSFTEKGKGYYNHDNGDYIENNSFIAFQPIEVQYDTLLSFSMFYLYFSGYVYKDTWYPLVSADVYYNTQKIPAGSRLYLCILEGWNYSIEVNPSTILPRIVRVGAGKDYAKLKDGIEAATQQWDSVVMVEDGEYDLVAEFGQSVLDSMVSGQNLGIVLKKNVHIIFGTNAKLTCHYKGSNEAILRDFSPFNASTKEGDGGFILENVTMECSGVRYCVHDERIGVGGFYKNEYRNCEFYLDNSNNPAWSSQSAIGGGLGKNAEIIVKDCYFKNSECYYHNAGGEGALSRIVISGNVFDAGYGISIQPHGQSTLMTRVYCSNNLMGRAIAFSPTSADAVNNMEVIDWNNITSA